MAAGHPAEPRRTTPDHPPYALMIRAAIQSLAEVGGSSVDSISAFIRANYDGLPWGHDKLLPYYLNKLTDLGEFVVAGDRYSLPVDEPVLADINAGSSDVSKSSQPSNAEAMTDTSMQIDHETQKTLTRDSDSDGGGEPSANNRRSSDLDAIVAVSMVNTNVVAVVSSNGDDAMRLGLSKVRPTIEAARPGQPKRRGRPRKGELCQMRDGVQDEPRIVEGGIVPSKPEAEPIAGLALQSNETVNVERSLNLKRRGRPPKSVLIENRGGIGDELRRAPLIGAGGVVPPKPVDGESIIALLLRSNDTENGKKSLKSKRRGRPPKRALSEKRDGIRGEPITVALVDGATLSELVAPLLLQSSGIESQNNVEGSSKRKRRGRPPKRALSEKRDGIRGESRTAALVEGVIASSVPLDVESVTPLFLQSSVTENRKKVKGCPNPKRRGRPPKRKLSHMRDDIPLTEGGIVSSAPLGSESITALILRPSDTENQKNVEGSSKIKRRGRPPKGALQLRVAQVKRLLKPSAIKDQRKVDGSTQTKRRGRPPKSATQMKIVVAKPEALKLKNVNVGSSMLKRRGRPPKMTLSQNNVQQIKAGANNSSMSLMNSLQLALTTDAPSLLPGSSKNRSKIKGSSVPKRRGRPPKRALSHSILPLETSVQLSAQKIEAKHKISSVPSQESAQLARSVAQ